MLVDSHCHLDFEVFAKDLDQVLSDAHQNQVKRFFVPGIKSQQWPSLKQLSQVNTSIKSGIGLHPYFLNEFITSDLDQLARCSTESWVSAIGECGIDGVLAERKEEECFSVAHQQTVFEAHIDIANQCNKPLVIHHRKSHHLIHQSFKRIQPLSGGVIHAFSGSLVDAQRYINLGFKLGCGGTITYERSKKTQSTFKNLDLSHIVLETDSPDMPLNGKQGHRNEPANILEIALCLATLKELTLEEVALKTSENCKELFGFSL
ncbi:TatD family hydrolase [Psychrosphaera haliotis]|nr:TatD family hydrolase [Psychrosphaera haliotis]